MDRAIDKGCEKRTMSGQLLIRMSPELLSRIQSASKRRSLSAAAWTREVLVEAVGGMPAEDDEVRPTPPPPPPIVPREDIAALSRAVGTLGKAVGIAKLLAMSLREAGDKTAHTGAESVLSELRRTAARVRVVTERLHKFAERRKT